MKKNDKNIDLIIEKAIEESNVYLEMYKYKLNYYENYLITFESNKDKYVEEHSLNDYETEKNIILKNIDKYKEEIKFEEDSINRMYEHKNDNKN